MDENRKKLYDQLSATYDMGTFDEFDTDLDNEDNQKVAWEAMGGQDGYGDFGLFQQAIARSPQAAETETTGNTGSAGNTGNPGSADATTMAAAAPMMEAQQPRDNRTATEIQHPTTPKDQPSEDEEIVNEPDGAAVVPAGDEETVETDVVEPVRYDFTGKDADGAIEMINSLDDDNKRFNAYYDYSEQKMRSGQQKAATGLATARPMQQTMTAPSWSGRYNTLVQEVSDGTGGMTSPLKRGMERHYDRYNQNIDQARGMTDEQLRTRIDQLMTADYGREGDEMRAVDVVPLVQELMARQNGGHAQTIGERIADEYLSSHPELAEEYRKWQRSEAGYDSNTFEATPLTLIDMVKKEIDRRVKVANRLDAQRNIIPTDPVTERSNAVSRGVDITSAYNITDALRSAERVYGTNRFESYVVAFAAKHNMTVPQARERVRELVTMSVAQDIIGALEPSSNAEYVLRKALTDNMVMNLARAGMTLASGAKPGDVGLFDMEDKAMAHYEQTHTSGWDQFMQVVATTSSFVVEGLGGGGFVLPGIVGKVVSNAAMKTLSRAGGGLFWKRLVSGSLGGTANFGIFESQMEAVRQLKTGERNPDAVWHSLVSGLAKGAGFGAVGESIGRLFWHSRGWMVPVGEVVKLAGETATFSAIGYLETGQLTPKDWATNFGMALGGKLTHPVQYIADVKKRMDGGFGPKVQSISGAYRDELTQKGYGTLAKVLHDGVLAQEDIGRVRDELSRMRSDNDVPMQTLQLAEFALNGRVLPCAPATGYRSTHQADGTWTLTPLDPSGRPLGESITVKGTDAKNAAEREMKRQIEKNAVTLSEYSSRGADVTRAVGKAVMSYCDTSGEDPMAVYSVYQEALRKSGNKESLGEVERQILDAVGSRLDDTTRIDNGIESYKRTSREAGYDIDKILDKPVAERTAGERKALDEYKTWLGDREEQAHSENIADFSEWVQRSDETAAANSARIAREYEQRAEELRGHVEELRGRMDMGNVVVLENIDQVENAGVRRQIEQAERKGERGVPGWYDERTDTTYVYLPHAESIEDLDRTIMHEQVTHHGLRVLKTQGYNNLCDRVWNSMSDAERDRWENYPGVKGIDDQTKRQRAAADEYIANLAERTDPESAGLWSRFVAWAKEGMRSLGIRTDRISDAELEQIIRESYRNLREQRGEQAERVAEGEPEHIHEDKPDDGAVPPDDGGTPPPDAGETPPAAEGGETPPPVVEPPVERPTSAVGRVEGTPADIEDWRELMALDPDELDSSQVTEGLSLLEAEREQAHRYANGELADEPSNWEYWAARDGLSAPENPGANAGGATGVAPAAGGGRTLARPKDKPAGPKRKGSLPKVKQNEPRRSEQPEQVERPEQSEKPLNELTDEELDGEITRLMEYFDGGGQDADGSLDRRLSELYAEQSRRETEVKEPSGPQLPERPQLSDADPASMSDADIAAEIETLSGYLNDARTPYDRQLVERRHVLYTEQKRRSERAAETPVEVLRGEFSEQIGKSKHGVELDETSIDDGETELTGRIKVDGEDSNVVLVHGEGDTPDSHWNYASVTLPWKDYEELSRLAGEFNRIKGRDVAREDPDALRINFTDIDDAIEFDRWTTEHEQEAGYSVREGETFKEYDARVDNPYKPDSTAALYVKNKYADRWEEITRIVQGITPENAESVGRELSKIIERDDAGKVLLTVNRGHVNPLTVLPFIDGISKGLKDNSTQSASQPQESEAGPEQRSGEVAAQVDEEAERRAAQEADPYYMPMENKGGGRMSPNYRKATAEQIFNHLNDRENASGRDTLDGNIADGVKRAEDKLKAVERREPKGKGRSDAALDKWEKELSEARAQLEKWREVERMRREQKAAEGDDSDPTWKQAYDAYTSSDEYPSSLEDYVARHLYGTKFKWKDKELERTGGRTHGLGGHLGLGKSEKERRGFFGWIDEKNGSYPESVAEGIHANMPDWMRDRYDTMEVLDAVLSVVGGNPRPRDMVVDYAKRLREQSRDMDEYYADEAAGARGFADAGEMDAYDNMREREATGFHDVAAAGREADGARADLLADARARLADPNASEFDKQAARAVLRFRQRDGRDGDTAQETDGDGMRYRIRTKEPPKKTRKVYKLMRLGEDGKLYPLFIDSASPVELGTWYDADSPNLDFLKTLTAGVHLVNAETGESMTLEQFSSEHPELKIKGSNPNAAAIDWATANGMRWMKVVSKDRSQRRYGGELRSYYNYGINGSGAVETYALRPGWHAGSLPTMRQIGKGPNKNLRDNRFVWVEGEVAADVDYQGEADANPDKDIPDRIPEDGYYLKATNADKAKSQADRVGWFVSGAFKANRIISDAEARRVIDQWNAEHPGQKVEYDYEREGGVEFSEADAARVNGETAESGGMLERNGQSTLQGLDGYTEDEVLSMVREDIEEKLAAAGADGVRINGMAIHGSRKRGDARPDSDLDVVVEYDGDISEDGLFNLLNDVPLTIEGVEVDINPIAEGKSGTLEQYMERSRRYDASKNAGRGPLFRIRDDERRPTFYSNAERAVENVKQGKATAEQWKAMLTKAGGIKAGEDKWMGLTDWLDEHKGQSLTKDEVLQFVRDNGIRMEEVNYGGDEQDRWRRIWDNLSWSELYDTAVRRIEERGGDSEEWDNVNDEIQSILTERYGEQVFEHIDYDSEGNIELKGNEIHSIREDYTTPGLENKREIAFVVPGIEPYQENDAVHFGPENKGRAVMWVRFGETRDTDGKRVLVIDEVQSNRHQDARESGYVPKRFDDISNERLLLSREINKFYSKLYGEGLSEEENIERKRLITRDNELAKEQEQLLPHGREDRIPDAPFEKNWMEVAMKRMLRLAAEEGFDKVAWTTGAQQAERYGIGGVVESITKGKTRGENTLVSVQYKNGKHDSWVVAPDGKVVDGGITTGENLSDLIGKELSEKVMSLDENGSISGDGLRIGGEGMSGFYDQIVPSFMRKYVKKWGSQVGEVELATPGGEVMHSVDVTEPMKESVMQGQPLFRIRGEHETGDRVRVRREGMNDGRVRVDGLPGEWRNIDEAGRAMQLSDPEHMYVPSDDGKWLDVYDWRDNEVWDIWRGKPGSKRYEKWRERTLNHIRKQVPEYAKKLGLDVELIEDESAVPAGHENEKSWYDAETGKIHIVVPRHAAFDVSDVMSSLWHEGVSRHGLRKLVGDDNYDTFLDNVYTTSDASIRAEIDRLAEEVTDGDRRGATEEYLSRLAEQMGFQYYKDGSVPVRSWMQRGLKVMRENFDKLCHHLGLFDMTVALRDDDLRAVLYNSYHHLLAENRDAYAAAKRAEREDKEYVKAVKRGDIDTAMTMLHRKLAASEGIVGYAAPHGHGGSHREVSHRLKDSDSGAIEQAARDMAQYVPKDAVLVPMPPHEGVVRKDTDTWLLAQELSRLTGAPVVAALRGRERESRYAAKQAGRKGLSADELGFYQDMELPDGKTPVFVDNVVGSGETAKAAVQAMGGKGMTLAYTKGNLGKPTEGLKNVTVTYDDAGNLIPLSERFDRSNSDVRFRVRDGRHGSDGIEEPSEERSGHEAAVEEARRRLENADASEFERQAARAVIKAYGGGSDDAPDTPGGGVRFRTRDDADMLVDMAKHNNEVARQRRDAVTDFVKAVTDVDELTDSKFATSLGKVMRGQRQYDQDTVADITTMVKAMMDAGLLTELDNFSVKQILTKVKDSTGKNDITAEANKLIDIMLKHQLRRGKRAFEQQLKVKGMRQDSRGVVVQGGLDYHGQRAAKALKEGLSLGDLQAVNDRIDEAEQRLSDPDEVVRGNAADELDGLYIARQYYDEIKQSEINEANIKSQLEQAQADHKNGTLSDEAYKQLRQASNDALRELRCERVDAWARLNEQLSDRQSESAERAKQFREQQKQRQAEIQHWANSDMEGHSADPHEQETRKKSAGDKARDVAQAVLQPLGTFDKLMRYFGNSHPKGEGYLFGFVRRFMNVRDQWFKERKADFDQMDAAARRIGAAHGARVKVTVAGGKIATRSIKDWADVYTYINQQKPLTVSVRGTDYQITQGNAAYLLAMEGQADGRMKLRTMGLTEADMDALRGQVDPMLLELSDWVVHGLLPGMRPRLNQTHIRMFGADMSDIPNYFPIRTSELARNETVNLAQQNGKIRPATITGSIIERKRNNLDLDLGADFFQVTAEHIDEMNHWNSFAEFARDLNTLLSYKRFKAQVHNLHSWRYGNGADIWKMLEDTAAITTGDYQPKTSKADTIINGATKGLAAANITFRPYTGLKQLLSAPVYLVQARWDDIGYAIANLKGTWQWAIKNLPTFAERWQGRMAGDPILTQAEQERGSQNKKLRWLSKAGFAFNAAVDATTVAIGARAIYRTKYRRYKDMGYSDEQANQKALEDASISVNETQQTGLGAFTSVIQQDRTFWSRALTIYRNASMGYQRQLVEGLKAMRNGVSAEWRATAKEKVAKKLERDGIDSAMAAKVADRLVNREAMRGVALAAMFGSIAPFVWALGAQYLGYKMAGGDDDEQEDKMLGQAKTHLLSGWVEGIVFGGQLSSAADFAYDYYHGRKKLRDYSLQRDLVSDMAEQILGKSSGKPADAVYDIVNMIVAMSTGVNPKSIVEPTVGIIDVVQNWGGDAKLAHEVALGWCRLLNVPQTSLDQVYIDEIGLSAKDAKKLSAEEFAERWCRYKRRRGAGWMSPLTSPESDAEQEGKLLKRYERMMDERFESLSDERVEQIMESDDELLKKHAAKAYKSRIEALTDDDVQAAIVPLSDSAPQDSIATKREGIKRAYKSEGMSYDTPSDRERNAQAYERHATMTDIAEDTALKGRRDALKKSVGDEFEKMGAEYKKGSRGWGWYIPDSAKSRADEIHAYKKAHEAELDEYGILSWWFGSSKGSSGYIKKGFTDGKHSADEVMQEYRAARKRVLAKTKQR